MNYPHKSVLLNECIDNLAINPNGIYVDGTTGLGGHSYQIASRLDNGKLICIDRDESSLSKAAARLEEYKDKVIFVHGNFSETANILEKLSIHGVNGMLFDLGVSSPQLDEAERGFSYMHDAPLDMRMDRSTGISAYDVVNSWDEQRLVEILFEYGEEKYSRRIADAICKSRKQKTINNTFELVDIIRGAMPSAALREKQHPAKRTFQAIRIAVNDELGEISQMLDTAPDKLVSGGRLCVISFHSLEDRIVKAGIARRENGCVCPREAPICVCGFRQTLKNVYRKPLLPTDNEIEDNPRARSAKLRVAERV